MKSAASRVQRVVRALHEDLRRSNGVRLTAAGLGGLLAYLLIRYAFDKNFTDYWTYMVCQIAGTFVLLLALDVYFAREGGFSWYTHFVVTANTWADTLGTAGHLYERHSSYDKLTHLCAGIAITTAAADILRALDERGVLSLSLPTQLIAAMSVTLLLNIGWETYEYIGDVVFHSARHQGSLDTTYDFISDMAGAFASALVIWRVRTARFAERAPAEAT